MSSIEQTIEPENCSSMAQVREGVDAIDRAMVALLQRRFAYMQAAAQIKAERSSVRDEARKAQVLSNVSEASEAAGLPTASLIKVWDMLIEASIAYELEHWDSYRS